MAMVGAQGRFSQAAFELSLKGNMFQVDERWKHIQELGQLGDRQETQFGYNNVHVGIRWKMKLNW